MGMTERLTVTEAEQITKGKLMEDLRAVVADAEELLKATADQTGERIAAACSCFFRERRTSSCIRVVLALVAAVSIHPPLN